MSNPYYLVFDHIADAVNPLLLLVALGLIVFSPSKKYVRALSQLIATTFIVYGLMYLDNKLKVWEMIGSDYSTHTATAIGLTIFIWFQTRKLLIKQVVCTVFTLYCILMLYQEYHTPLDIISTALINVILILPLYKNQISLFFRKKESTQ